MILAILILIVFLIFAALMYTQKMPAILALPVMAVLIAAIGGVPLGDILTTVISQGSYRLSSAIAVIFFGAILGQFVNKSGIEHPAPGFLSRGPDKLSAGPAHDALGETAGIVLQQQTYIAAGQLRLQPLSGDVLPDPGNKASAIAADHGYIIIHVQHTAQLPGEPYTVSMIL